MVCLAWSETQFWSIHATQPHKYERWYQAGQQMLNRTETNKTEVKVCHLTVISPVNALHYLHEHRCVDMNIWISLINQQSYKRALVLSATLGNLPLMMRDTVLFCLRRDILIQLSFPHREVSSQVQFERGTVKPNLGSHSRTLQQDRCLPSSGWMCSCLPTQCTTLLLQARH